VIQDEPVTTPEAAAPPPAEERQSPYSNLVVPLVVIPGLIVMVLVLIFLMFGAITGEEKSPRENLDRILHGGANEREQAAFNLARQLLEQRQQYEEESNPEWRLDPSLAPAIDDAWDEMDPEDGLIRFVLAQALALLDEPEGVIRLVELTRTPPSLDEDGQVRFLAAKALGDFGRELEGAPADHAATALIDLSRSEDEGLRLIAAAALQAYPGEATRAALADLLGEGSVQLRLQAALSLAELGDPAGEAVLTEMCAVAPYEEERARHRERWTEAELISLSRRKALRALADIGRAPARERLEELASGDADPNIREIARELLSEQ
jgi:HEAT repeat protein